MIITILDIETTGLDKCIHDILEVAYMRIDSKTLEILSHGTLYFYKPEFRIENQAQAVHGLTREYLTQFENEFDDNIVSLYTLIQQSVVIGKNSDNFDLPFISMWLNRKASILAPVCIVGTLDIQEFLAPHYRKWVASCTGVMPSTRKKGTLEEYMDMFGYTQESLKMDFIKLYGSERAHAHGALFDVYMTYICVKEAVKQFGLRI